MRLSDLLRHAFERLVAVGIAQSEARVEARMLIQHTFGLTREQIITRSEDAVDPALLEPLLVRREAREPLAYLLGEREFYGLPFFVTSATLIPRPETELLVEIAREFLPSPPAPSSRVAHSSLEEGSASPLSPLFRPRNEGIAGRGAGGDGPNIADIGTGSGCIAVTLAKLLPNVSIYATDISEDALIVARRNAERHGANVTFLQGDLLAPLPENKLFDAIISNPPYIAQSEASTLAPEVIDGEPHVALFDREADGLGFYRRLAREAPEKLAPGGLLAVEVGMGQSDAVARLFADAGLKDVRVIPDLAGIGRVVCGNLACVAENGELEREEAPTLTP